MGTFSFRDLKIWKESYALTLGVYHLTSSLPPAERFGLQSQIRRAAVSIPTNIAEGFGRRTAKDLLHFLHIARGSAQEVDCLLMLARDLGYVEKNTTDSLIERYKGLSAGIYAYIGKIRQRS